MQKAIDKMTKGTSTELDCQKLFVIKGRHDLYHGVSSGSCMSVLVALCALSYLLRNLRPSTPPLLTPATMIFCGCLSKCSFAMKAPF